MSQQSAFTLDASGSDTAGDPFTGKSFEKRDLRAATEGITLENEAPGMYEARGKYMLDIVEAVCECPDHRYRNNHCKHLRKAEMLEDDRDIPPVPGLDEDLRQKLEKEREQREKNEEHEETPIADGGVATSGPLTPSEREGLADADADEEISLRGIVAEQTSTVEDLTDFSYDEPAGWNGEPYSSIVGFAADTVDRLIETETTTPTEQ